jgi:glycosyltransferase involved in cell wall biosynthesis
MDHGTTLISVVIPSYNSRHTISQCLQALDSQRISPAVKFEVIVVDSSSDDSAAIVGSQFPWVTLYKFTERKFPGDARNYGAAHAKGSIIAFTDADCFPNPNWLAQLAQAHNAGRVVVGGSIENANPNNIVGWAQYFCEFSAWFPQMPSRFAAHIPAGCFSIRRWAFEKYGPFLCGTLSEDTALCWALVGDGHRPFFDPVIKVAHVHVSGLKRFLLHRLNHGRAFASVRVRQQGFSLARSLFYVAISPLLPFLLFYRTAKRVITARAFLRQFVVASPLVALGMVAWSCGEFMGYWHSVGYYPARSTSKSSPGSEIPKPDVSTSLGD